jgi:integrase
MSVIVRPYRRGGWEVDIRLVLPDNSEHRERRKAPVTSKTAAQRWGEAREREWYHQLTYPQPKQDAPKEVPTLETFWPRFIDGYVRANRQKPSSIAAKETIGRVHLVRVLGARRVDAITTESVQQLKHQLNDRSAKTVNNVLTVLNVLLKQAVEWDIIERMPCAIRLLPIPKSSAHFHDFDEHERLVATAKVTDPQAYIVVLLGGEAGLRCGEMMALEWRDVDVRKRQLCIERSEWKRHVTVPKGGRMRHVPMTIRLANALRSARHLRGPRVLCSADGSPLTQRDVQGLVLRAARRANLRHVGVHVLRHTFCSHLSMRGAPVRAIQELAGHQELGTTQRYMHLSPAAIDGAIRLLDERGATPQFGDMLETGPAPSENEQI